MLANTRVSASSVKGITDFLTKPSIYLLWLAAVFDPIGTIGGFRYLALFLVYLILVIRIFQQGVVVRKNDYYTWAFRFFVLFLPIYGLLICLLRGGFSAEFIDTSYLGSAVLFSCSLIYLNNNLVDTGFKAMLFSQRLLSLVIIMTFITYSTPPFSIHWMYFFEDAGVAYIGMREYSGIHFYYIYFIASPMIIFLMVYEICRFADTPSLRNFILSMLPVVALFLSGTRVNMCMAVVAVPVVFFWRKWGALSILYGFIYILSGIVILKVLNINLLQSVFSPNEYSNSIKLGLLRYYGIIFSDPITVVFGQGFNAQAWSETFRIMLGSFDSHASRTELTYLEFFRVYGVFVGIFFLSLISLMIKKLMSTAPVFQWMGIAVLVYMIGSTLNPYIFSSNGMLPLGLFAAVLQRHRASFM